MSPPSASPSSSPCADNTKADILAAFETPHRQRPRGRVRHGLPQVERIALLRLEDIAAG
jgi:2-oxo-4-hydroxy-4-carboxy--5-ureidoimidazoline (OHCU) decarboxylase